MTCDIVIRNGHVVDPATGTDGVKTIGILGNRIVEGAEAGKASVSEVDAAGCYVFPGLVDHHAHLFYGASEFCVKPETCLPFGVTAMVDPGTAGSANFDSFYQNIIVGSIPRIRAYISVNPGGLYGREYHTHYDASLLSPGRMSYQNIKAIFEKYPEQLLGLKLMLSTANVGDQGIEILEATLRLADEIGCRVCVHTTDMSITAADVAGRLRPGDIYCHCFTCTDGRSILDEAGRVRPEVLDARRRGVIFDAANGTFHYDHEVAETAIAQGFSPDVLGSDIVIYAANMGHKVRSLPFLMSKYRNVGMDLLSVVRMVTQTPARLMGMEGEIGTLAPGAFADVAIFKWKEAKAYFEDAKSTYRETDRLLVPQMTIADGKIVYCQVDFNNGL